MPGRGFHEAPGATWNLGLHTRPVVASASEIATSLSYGPAEIFTPLIINNHDVFQCFRTLKWSSHVQPCLWSSAGTPLCLRADQGSVQDMAPMVPTWFGSPHLWKSWSLGASASLFFFVMLRCCASRMVLASGPKPLETFSVPRAVGPRHSTTQDFLGPKDPERLEVSNFSYSLSDFLNPNELILSCFIPVGTAKG